MQVRNATLAGENSAERVGRIFVGVLDLLSQFSLDELTKIFLRKDQPDQASFLVSFLAGAVFGKAGFASGLTGFGARIDENGNGEMESLILRRFLEVPELRYNRISVTLGDKWNAPGAGIIEQIEPDIDGDGNLQMTGTGYLKLEEGEYGAIDVGDICMGIFHSEKAEDNATADSDDSCGNFQYAGFYTCYFTITEITGSNNKQFRYQLRPVSERWKLTFHPCQAMHFVCYGSFTNADRQTSTYTTRTYTRRLWKQNTWEISAANIASQSGDLSNLAVHGLQMSGYSEYVNNVYLTGVIKQIKPDGTPVLTVNDRGAWTTGMKCDFYDRVSYDGRIWLCINEDGTSAMPSKDNVDWLLQVDKGADGTSFTIKDKLDDISQLPAEGNSIGDGYLIAGHLWVWNGQTFEDKGSIQGPAGQSVSVLGRWQTGMHVPYLGIVKMGTATWMCTVPEGTDNPPMWTITDKDGNRLLQTQDGGKTYGYILTGTENSTEYIMIAQDGTDGIPGEPGKDGKVLYTWIRYADDAQGNGISDSPVGKKFLGLAHNKETSVESNDPKDYQWSDIKGEDGIGLPGENGKTYYTWVAYSDNADGSGMYQQPNENTKYIGIAVNKETAVESTNPTDYTWSKFKGEDGKDGEDGDSISNHGQWQTGKHIPYLGIVRMGNATWQCTVPAGTDNPPMWTITDKDGNRLLQTQDGGKTYGYILTGTENSTEYIMIAQDGTDGIPGEPGKDGKVLYTWIRYADDAQGNGISDSPVGKKFLGLAHNKETSVESNDPKDYQWSDIKGEDGIGLPGENGKTYYTWVAYSDNADGSGMYQQPNENTKYIGIAVNKETAVESTNPTDYTWSKFKGEDGKDGEDGDSISNHGQWQTGKHIPYLGIVRMGNATWQCTVPAGTDNPPMWTITDKDGNRLLQTQDGGKTYGYILTGELNTAEYELVAQDGTDGESIKGDPGIQGCIIRKGEWKIGVEWRNDESLTSGTRYLDVALVRDGQVATGWKAYKCKTTHTSSLANAPGNSTYWEEFGLNTTAIFTSLIIAKDAQIDFMQGNQLLIKKDDGTVTAGLSGKQTGKKVRIWVGDSDPENAPIQMCEEGDGMLAGGNIRWDKYGNTFFDGSIIRHMKNLESTGYDIYLDFLTGFNFDVGGIITTPYGKSTIYLPNAAEYEGVECTLYWGNLATRYGSSPIVKVAGGGYMISADIYQTAFNSFTFNDYGLAQLKALPCREGETLLGVRWYVINPGNNILVGE